MIRLFGQGLYENNVYNVTFNGMYVLSDRSINSQTCWFKKDFGSLVVLVVVHVVERF